MTSISAGFNHSVALLANGTVRAWGYNGNGSLGDGTFTSRTTPVPVAGLTNVTAVDAGGYHNLALLSDGTVRAWGDNSAGQIGDGTTITRSVPVTVVGLSGVTAIDASDFSHSLAILSNGTVRAWGNNAYGQIGDGSVTNQLIPITIAGLSNVAAIDGGFYHTAAVLKDGTVKTWGRNDEGAIGDGTFTTRLVPTIVPNVNSATGIDAAGYSTYVLRQPIVVTGSISATVDGSGNLTILDTDSAGKNNQFTIKKDGSGNLVISDANEQFVSAPSGWTLAPDGKSINILASSFAGTVTVNGAEGTDTLSVDYSGGLLPTINYDGGNPIAAPGDGLIVKGSGTQTASYMPDATVKGNGVVTTSAGTINFTGLEPVDITGMVTATLVLPGADDVLTLVNGVDFLSGGVNPAIRVTGSSGGVGIESAAFWNNGTVVIDTVTGGINGNDTITVTSASVGNNTNLTINTGTGVDAVNINGPVSVSGAVSITTVNLNSIASGTINTGTGLTVNNTGTASNLLGAIGQSGSGAGLTLAGTVGLNNLLSSTFNNFHPQGLGYDPFANELLFLQQSSGTIYRTDLNGNLLGSRLISPFYNHTVSVAADSTNYYFSDFTGNTVGPDLFFIGKAAGTATQISSETAAYGGYPLDVRGGLIYRTQPSTFYGYNNLNQIRIASTSAPDTILNTLNLAVPQGIADFSVDTAGNNIWVLEYSATASIRQFDLTTGVFLLLNVYPLGLDGLDAGLTFAQGKLTTTTGRGFGQHSFNIVTSAARRLPNKVLAHFPLSGAITYAAQQSSMQVLAANHASALGTTAGNTTVNAAGTLEL
ncbi:MAG: hypothetical protein U0894_16025 [Pirellulales bacterium]